MSNRYVEAVRQAEFLNKLSRLMNEYNAEFIPKPCFHPQSAYWISILLGGVEIPEESEPRRFDVDACIGATARANSRVKALGEE